MDITDIKSLRLKKNWNQSTLASLCGLTQSTLADIENGKRPLSDAVAKRIANALGAQDYVLKRGHTVAAVKSKLADIAKLSDADIKAALETSSGRESMRAALKALDEIQRDTAVAEPVRKSAQRGLERLSDQTTRALKERGYLNDDLGRDTFGRARKSLDEVTRDMYGRRKKTPDGSSR